MGNGLEQVRDTLRPWKGPDGRYTPPQAVLDYWATLATVPWSPALCPPEGDCRGFYSGHQLECPHAGKYSCPRKSDIERARRDEWLAGIGFGREYWGVQGNRMRQRRDIDEYCRRLYRGDLARGTNLFLMGGVGTGKTMSLAWIALQGMGKGLQRQALRVYSAPELVSWLVDTNHDIGILADLAVLMIDDLGTEHWSERSSWAASRMGDLVERRHRELRPTIITTNLSVWDLGQRDEWTRWTDRWFSRGETIQFDGESMRGRAA